MKKILTLLTAFVILAAFSQITYGEEKIKSITMAEANAIATKAIHGEIVEAEREKGYYEIKIRTSEDRVEKVYVDAKDGSIMKRDRGEYRDRDRDHHSHGDKGRDRDSDSR